METRNKLILLGLIYGLCVIVIGLIVSLLTSGDIAQWKNVQGQIDPQSVLSHIPWLGFIVGAVLYAMLLGITCFSLQFIPHYFSYRSSTLSFRSHFKHAPQILSSIDSPTSSLIRDTSSKIGRAHV